MRITRLADDFDIPAFDCGDEDLNDFILNEAKAYREKRLANTFIVEEDGKIVAYFCLLNDKISKNEVSNAAWRKIRKMFPHEKFFSSYPSIKIGRFAVSREYQGKGFGKNLMDCIKYFLNKNNSDSSFRFLTVDAYANAVPFYEKNGFRLVMQSEPNEITKTMYFDMLQIQ